MDTIGLTHVQSHTSHIRRMTRRFSWKPNNFQGEPMGRFGPKYSKVILFISTEFKGNISGSKIVIEVNP